MKLVERLVDGEAMEVPWLAALAVQALAVQALAEQVCDRQTRIQVLERELMLWFCSNEIAKRLETIPGSPAQASADVRHCLTARQADFGLA